MKSPFATAALLLAFIAPAGAHTPYLVPAEFAPRAGQSVSLDAAFAETFFVPEVAFDDSRFTVTGPDGHSRPLQTVQVFKTRTVAEQVLPQDAKGTYRFSTGPRLGALFRTWEVDGKRESSRDPAAKIPARAKVIADFQSLTLAETYVSVGEPDRGALAPHGKGLELAALTHPDDLYVGEKFQFTVLYDGKPLPDQKVEVTEAVWSTGRTPRTLTVVTDAQGQAALALDQAGTWVALSRYRTRAPVGAPTSEISNSYTLTFRVLDQ